MALHNLWINMPQNRTHCLAPSCNHSGFCVKIGSWSSIYLPLELAPNCIVLKSDHPQ